MCGRLNILANMLNNKVSDELRIRYHTVDNPDLSPRQNVSTIINSTCGLQQFDGTIPELVTLTTAADTVC